MIVGIDNGIDGGAVAIGPLGHVIGSFVMPSFKIVKVAKTKSKKAGKTVYRTLREIDAKRLLIHIDNLTLGNRNAQIYFEECPDHASSAASMRGMGINAGKILGVLESNRYTATRLLSSDWQPEILGSVPKGKTKEYALEKVKEIWPDEIWQHNKKQYHGGLVDAALIAEFGRRKTT